MKPRLTGTSAYLGTSEIEKHVYLNSLSRSMHTQIVGSTGVGKTESVILPLIFNDILTQKGVIFIDPKGDSSTFQFIQRMTDYTSRTHDLVKIDLANPKESGTYNPLKIGSSSELKDKVTGSIVWTEEFYKKVAERALLYIFNELERLKITATVPSLSKLFNPKEEGPAASDKVSAVLRAEIQKITQYIKSKEEDLEGVKTDLYLWSNSTFSDILRDEEGASALEWLTERKIVYINLNTLAFEDTSRRFGRLVIQDIKTAVQRLQSTEAKQRTPCCLYIDEFASIASSGFIELLNKARSAGLQITMAHQSYGDLTAVSPSFANQILDNTNIKILFRVDGPESTDFFSKFGGTRKSFSKALQTARKLGADVVTGDGTISEINKFILDPNAFRTLTRGQAFVITKIPNSASKITFLPIEDRLKVISKELTKGRKSCFQNILNSFCWD